MNTRTRRLSNATIAAAQARIGTEARACQSLAQDIANLAAEFEAHADTADLGTLDSIQEIRRQLVEILARRSPTYRLSETAARNEVLAEHGLI